MTVIEAAHYEQTRTALAADPIIARMAGDVAAFHGGPAAALQAVAHPDRSTPRHEFMLQALNGYKHLGGQIPSHLGGVAEAIIRKLIADV